MAISPPSDILLDVANAADPAAVRAATARLAALAADPGAGNAGFSAALKEAAKLGQTDRGEGAQAAGMAAGTAAKGAGGASVAATLAALPSPVGGVHRRADADRPDVYRKFEAVLLQSFVESMLPKDSELFGDKQSAGVYRSMMAEQLADQISRAGGVGIAKSLEARAPLDGGAPAGGHRAGPVAAPVPSRGPA